jgi:hypothetical protein
MASTGTAGSEESAPLVPIAFALGLAFGLGLFIASLNLIVSLAVAAVLGGLFAVALLLWRGRS